MSKMSGLVPPELNRLMIQSEMFSADDCLGRLKIIITKSNTRLKKQPDFDDHSSSLLSRIRLENQVKNKFRVKVLDTP